jgi:hypothetical protein
LRQEDKEIDGADLEREEERRRANELVSEDEEQLYDLDGKPEFERDGERTGTVTTAMRKILEGDHVAINDLALSQRELRALEAIKTAVEGRDQEINGFVYAEDRRALLEQALAVLQPDLAQFQKIGGPEFEQLLHDVAELREHLEELEDSQDEEEVIGKQADKAEDAADRDDDDEDDDKSLTGPERKIAKPTSSLGGPERKEEPKPASSLSGPERKEEPKSPTTLGDPKEIAAAAKPWWKR